MQWLLQFSKKNAFLVFLSGSLTNKNKVKKTLNMYKWFHSPNISTKILKQNVGFFSTFVLSFVNKSTS